jgi:hypothetical protein
VSSLFCLVQIDKLIRQFCTDPVFVIIDVRPGVAEVPTTAYESVEEVWLGTRRELIRPVDCDCLPLSVCSTCHICNNNYIK